MAPPALMRLAFGAAITGAAVGAMDVAAVACCGSKPRLRVGDWAVMGLMGLAEPGFNNLGGAANDVLGLGDMERPAML